MTILSVFKGNMQMAKINTEHRGISYQSQQQQICVAVNKYIDHKSAVNLTSLDWLRLSLTKTAQ